MWRLSTRTLRRPLLLGNERLFHRTTPRFSGDGDMSTTFEMASTGAGIAIGSSMGHTLAFSVDKVTDYWWMRQHTVHSRWLIGLRERRLRHTKILLDKNTQVEVEVGSSLQSPRFPRQKVTQTPQPLSFVFTHRYEPKRLAFIPGDLPVFFDEHPRSICSAFSPHPDDRNPEILDAIGDFTYCKEDVQCAATLFYTFINGRDLRDPDHFKRSPRLIYDSEYLAKNNSIVKKVEDTSREEEELYEDGPMPEPPQPEKGWLNQAMALGGMLMFKRKKSDEEEEEEEEEDDIDDEEEDNEEADSSNNRSPSRKRSPSRLSKTSWYEVDPTEEGRSSSPEKDDDPPMTLNEKESKYYDIGDLFGDPKAEGFKGLDVTESETKNEAEEKKPANPTEEEVETTKPMKMKGIDTDPRKQIVKLLKRLLRDSNAETNPLLRNEYVQLLKILTTFDTKAHVFPQASFFHLVERLEAKELKRRKKHRSQQPQATDVIDVMKNVAQTHCITSKDGKLVSIPRETLETLQKFMTAIKEKDKKEALVHLHVLNNLGIEEIEKKVQEEANPVLEEDEEDVGDRDKPTLLSLRNHKKSKNEKKHEESQEVESYEDVDEVDNEPFSQTSLKRDIVPSKKEPSVMEKFLLRMSGKTEKRNPLQYSARIEDVAEDQIDDQVESNRLNKTEDREEDDKEAEKEEQVTKKKKKQRVKKTIAVEADDAKFNDLSVVWNIEEKKKEMQQKKEAEEEREELSYKEDDIDADKTEDGFSKSNKAISVENLLELALQALELERSRVTEDPADNISNDINLLMELMSMEGMLEAVAGECNPPRPQKMNTNRNPKVDAINQLAKLLDCQQK